MIRLRSNEYAELERTLNNYTKDPKTIQLGAGSLPLLRTELRDFGFKIRNNDFMSYVESTLSPYLDQSILAKINNVTLSEICKEIKDGIIVR